MNKLLEKLKKNTTSKLSATLDKSTFFNSKDMIQTQIPMLNVAFSGSLDGGFTPGLSVIAGPSKHFKTVYMLIAMKAYLEKYPDAVALLYDSEFGSPLAYFDVLGIPHDRVFHTPIVNIEELKFDIMQHLETLERGEKLFIGIDSIGNLASIKEVEDAIEQKSVGDMSRAKMLKSFFRIVTPYLTIKDIPMFVINHVYQEQKLYGKTIVSGGCLVSGTKIQTVDGLKEIQNINVGDFVKTLNGNKIVTHTWKPETLEFGNPECYEIEFDDGYVCSVSNQHPFLTDSGWIDSEDLVEGTKIITSSIQ